MFIPKILSTYLFSGENFLLTHNFGLRLLSRHVSTKKILLYLSAEGMVNLSLSAEGSLILFLSLQTRRVSQKFLLTLLSAESLIFLLKMILLLKKLSAT